MVSMGLVFAYSLPRINTSSLIDR